MEDGVLRIKSFNICRLLHRSDNLRIDEGSCEYENSDIYSYISTRIHVYTAPGLDNHNLASFRDGICDNLPVDIFWFT